MRVNDNVIRPVSWSRFGKYAEENIGRNHNGRTKQEDVAPLPRRVGRSDHVDDEGDQHPGEAVNARDVAQDEMAVVTSEQRGAPEEAAQAEADHARSGDQQYQREVSVRCWCKRQCDEN